ncbi:hypothetical protein NC651_014733 [Populus alba x Populus x berolinensis]|nr:hypothetical protein NC651_014733 [Populus alba x Populus x berolinensis]
MERIYAFENDMGSLEPEVQNGGMRNSSPTSKRLKLLKNVKDFIEHLKESKRNTNFKSATIPTRGISIDTNTVVVGCPRDMDIKDETVHGKLRHGGTSHPADFGQQRMPWHTKRNGLAMDRVSHDLDTHEATPKDLGSRWVSKKKQEPPTVAADEDFGRSSWA